MLTLLVCHSKYIHVQEYLFCVCHILTKPDCLNKNAWQEEKCQAQVDALYECCNAFYQERGDQASVVSCPKANLLRLKMRQRAQAAEKEQK